MLLMQVKLNGTFKNQRLTAIIVFSRQSKIHLYHLAMGILLAFDCQCHDHKLELKLCMI